MIVQAAMREAFRLWRISVDGPDRLAERAREEAAAIELAARGEIEDALARFEPLPEVERLYGRRD